MGVSSGCGCKEVYRFPHTKVGHVELGQNSLERLRADK